MKLTPDEQDMLAGKKGNAVKKSMQILVALGEIYGAKSLIPVKSVQISGVSYDNLGDAGLEYLSSMAQDGKVCVKTTLNPAGMDMENWRQLGISEEFAKKQVMVIDAFKKMGVDATCTCTPYFIGNKPAFGDHIAWGESSAITYANSVLGAKTNKEGGPSSIASALTGKTPEYGLHLDENRQAQFVAQVNAKIDTPMLFGALGNLLGNIAKGRIPLILGINNAAVEDLKSFSASFVTYGGAPMFHMDGITPNKTTVPAEKVIITENDIENAIKQMTDNAHPDFVFVGCPHCSLDEIRKISEILKGKHVAIELWIGVARPVKNQAETLGYVKIIEDAGAKFACDTCHVVSPLKGRFSCLLTDSAKGVYYGRGKNSFKTVFANTEDCIRMALRDD
jgi:predicted aconitase